MLRLNKKTLLAAIAIALLNSLPAPTMEKESASEIRANKDWCYSLALQAASYGAPIVTMYALRQNDAIGAKAKAAPNKIWRMENISTPTLAKEAGYVTPNVNVIYGFGFMDLRQEPIILQVPNSNDRYYLVEIVDMWTNAFAYVGGKTTGYKGGTFALVGPNWKGQLPDGVQRIDCPTPWILLQPRVHLYVDGKSDLRGGKAILDAITTTGLAAYTRKPAPAPVKYTYPAPQPINPALPVSAIQYKDPLQFWELLMLAMNENPPPQNQIEALLPMFKPLGIELGKPWDRSAIEPEVLEAMSAAANAIGPLIASLPIGERDHGAFLPPPTIGDFGTDYQTRAVVGRLGLTATSPFEAVYWLYILDETGTPLTGEKKYTMTFKEEIPFYAPGFWSITMYDATNNYTVPNPINRYMLGSDTPSLMKNPDGSFTIYIQADSPGKEKEPNWLPAPRGPFYLIPRSYAPKPETIEILTNPKSWPVPGVVSVQQ